MKITIPEVKTLLTLMGYIANNETDIWQKNYANDYSINVNFSTRKIIYNRPIKLGDETTSNFENSENFVVLECVNRLLEKGYPAKSIELEHKWSMGRKEKGKLDILVKDENNKTFLMIECKTAGDEFGKEYDRMRKDGGQLFSYFQQDKNAQFLCLYASHVKDDEIEFKNEIVEIVPVFRELGSVKETYER